MSETKEKQPTLEERLAAVEKENAKLKGKVKDLNEELQVKEATAPKDALPIVKVDGKFYQFVSRKFKPGKEVVTCEDAAKNADLCAALVAKGSGVLVEVKKNK
jgi:hypothetical protein